MPRPPAEAPETTWGRHPLFVALLAVTALGVVRGTQRYVWNQMPNMTPLPLSKAFLGPLLSAYTWALLAPAILWLLRRSLRVSARRAALVQLPASVLFCAVKIALVDVWLTLLGLDRMTLATLPMETWASIRAGLDRGLVDYAALVAIFWGIDAYRRSESSAVDLAAMETELAEARLRALRTHLNPPFFFSTLNTILPLISRDKETAARVVVMLGDLLRLTFRREGRDEIPLEEELRYLDVYLKIEAVRFQDRLTVAFDVEPECQDAPVPNLILLPLVELLVEKGVEVQMGVRLVTLRAWTDGGRLLVTLAETGAETTRDDGALADVRLREAVERLRHLYGPAGELSSRFADGALTVTLAVPLRTTAACASERSSSTTSRTPVSGSPASWRKTPMWRSSASAPTDSKPSSP